ncbi:MAG TPA: ATP-binding protein [Novimethylophilus sp.]|uniref:ATP-binding protein n=1 Tax=Novimethylophilus sp. TaxID=2137426 RepID=UPI002F411DF5
MIKSFFRSMGGRVFILLIAGVIASAALALALAAYAQRGMVTQIRSRHAAERVEQLVLALDAVPVASRPVLAAIAQKSGTRADFSAYAVVPGASTDSEFVAELMRVLGADRHIVAFQRAGDDCPARASEPIQNNEPRRCRTVFMHLADGSPIRLDVALQSNRLPPPFSKDFLPYLLVFVLCVAALAFLVALISTRPLRKLAQAANDLGHNIERPPLAENAGPAEVREAAAAFNDMQLRIRNYIQERTHMLAAIAHDLQTPLTRMRLRLEKVSDEELKEKLIADLSATQAMVKEGLELARSLDAEESFEMLDLDSLIDSICSDAAEAGQDVTHNSQVEVSVMARPRALRRCLLNLVENAVKYGQFAHVAAKRDGDRVVVSIVDGGPGIPNEQLDAVFQPFYRLETSRSREFGGTGLGLTIARNIAEKHRGTLKLRNIRTGGLGLEVTLSLAVC